MAYLCLARSEKDMVAFIFYIVVKLKQTILISSSKNRSDSYLVIYRNLLMIKIGR